MYRDTVRWRRARITVREVVLSNAVKVVLERLVRTRLRLEAEEPGQGIIGRREGSHVRAKVYHETREGHDSDVIRALSARGDVHGAKSCRVSIQGRYLSIWQVTTTPHTNLLREARRALKLAKM